MRTGVRVGRPKRLAPARSTPSPRSPAWAEGLLGLQRVAGNRAVISVLQRVGGWSDAAKDGQGTDDRKGWNEGEHRVGSIRRIPIEGLTEGNQRAWQSAGSASAALTDESAAGRAIALVPADLAPGKDVDVLLFFHGYAETTARPYAGWRQRSSDHTVRDVAQDHMEQQLQGSGATQMIGVLAQGGEQSEFGGKSGRADFDPDTYIGQVLHALEAIGAVNHPLKLGRVIMAAHSGGGHLVRAMEVGEGRAHMPSHLGELVLFDAINTAQELNAATSWVTAHLNADVRALADPNATEETRRHTFPRACAFARIT
jgi:hypothetical protein